MTLLEKQKNKIFFLLFISLTLFLAIRGISVLSWGPGTNYANVSVRATVNVTNAYPEVINISCSNTSTIALTAGSAKEISCLAQLRDFDGGNTINYVNGTFYFNQNASSDPDDNNTHYTNSSCTNTSTSGYDSNWTCVFPVWYYAVNGTWRINVTVNDSSAYQTNSYRNATISALLALNVTNLINFGDLAVTQTSPTAVEANVTNLGNVPINVSVYGFGDESEALYAGYAMICDQRNITISNERYDLSSATNYDAMTRLTSSPAVISSLKIYKQTTPATYMTNSTYWRLHVNATNNPFGVCNGTVVFAAVSS